MSRDSSKPTTSKRAIEDDEENERQSDETPKYQNQPLTKKKSHIKVKPENIQEGKALGKKQLNLAEAAYQTQVIKEEKHRPLFFKPKFKLPESMAHHMIRRALKQPERMSPTWGVLEFYEGRRFVSSCELKGEAPIHVKSRLLLDLQAAHEDVSEYTDWDHALMDGFVLLKSPGPHCLITMQRASKTVRDETNYKVFNGVNEFYIETNDRRTIYDGGNVMNNMPFIRDMRLAYDFSSKYCCVQIAILGKFVYSMGMPQSIIKTLDRELITCMPYWLMIKVLPEFTELDRHLLRSVRLL